MPRTFDGGNQKKKENKYKFHIEILWSKKKPKNEKEQIKNVARPSRSVVWEWANDAMALVGMDMGIAVWECVWGMGSSAAAAAVAAAAAMLTTSIKRN